MKDIDFDELDRAVGTVLGADAPAQKDPEAAPAEPSTSVATTTPDPDPAPSPLASATIKPATSPARKRGQFLDMVHPSADMRNAKSTMPTNQRKTIAPLNSTIQAPKPAEGEQPPVQQPAIAPEDAPRELIVPEPSAAEVTAAPDFTDTAAKHEESHIPAEAANSSSPTDLKENDTKSVEETKPTEEVAWPDPLDVAAPEKSDSTSLKDDTPGDASEESTGQTPFVPGVEVEKRPLGSSPSVDPPAASSPLTSPDVSDDTTQPVPTDSQSDLSGPELSEELNSIEANGVADAEEPTDTVPLPGTTPEPAPAAATEKPSVASKPETPAAPAPVAHDAPVGAQSITPQYKQADAKTDSEDDDHPLFDTEEYHQPLLPVGKKKSGKGLLLIVLFVILVLVGCALGYLAFTMGL